MAIWNDFDFNKNPAEGGTLWNAKSYTKLITTNEEITLDDDISEMFAKIPMQESLEVVDTSSLNAFLIAGTDAIHFTETASIGILYTIMEQVLLDDNVEQIIAELSTNENILFVENLSVLISHIISESIKFNENFNINAVYKLLEKINLDDLKSGIKTFLNENEIAYLLDGEPKTSISDMLIGAVDRLDRAYDWLIPFGLKIDWDSTEIPRMPEAEITSIEMPGMDGSIVQDTVYKDRLFKIVGFSADGLTKSEKELLVKRITKILDSMKHKTRKLTVQARDVTFDAKYEGDIDIKTKGGYVRAEIPFRVPPYGYSTFDEELAGDGLIVNDGNAPLFVTHIISGAVTNPTFTFNQIQYSYNGDIAADERLIINNELLTCYIENNLGKKINTLSKLTGEFTSIPTNSSASLIVPDNLKSKIKTVWNTKYLW